MIAYTKPTAPAVVVATARLTLRTWPRWLVAIAVHIAVLALFSLLTVVRAPGILAHPDSMVAPDGIDPVYHVWGIANLLHNLTTWPHGLWSLFDANIYYPTPHAAAYGDVAVGLLPLIVPLHLLISNPVALYNALVGLAFVLSAYGGFWLGLLVTGNRWAAIVAGLIFGFCPLRSEQAGHLQIISSQWLVFAACLLVVAWRNDRLHWWIAAGFALGLASINNLYDLAYLFLPLAIVALALGRSWTWRRAVRALLALLLAAIFVAPFVIPYLTRHAGPSTYYGGASSTDTLSFARTLAGRPLDGALLPTTPIQLMQPNEAAFPGFVALFLAAVAWRRRRAVLWLVFAAASAVLALGPYLKIDDIVLPVPLPYALLQVVVPYFTLFRDPTRALMGFSLGLAVAAAWGMCEMLTGMNIPQWHRMVGPATIVMAALELWSPVQAVPVAAIPAGERWLAHQPAIHAVLELPISHKTPLDWQRQSEIMYDSTVNWKLLVNGSTAIGPSGIAARRKILSSYPSPAALTMVHRLHIDAVVLRLEWLTPAQRAQAETHCRVAFRDTAEEICTQP